MADRDSRSSPPSPTAAVTGASPGIGAAIASAFAGLGWSVAIGARRLDRLHEVAAGIAARGGTCFVHALDVADPSSIEAFFAAFERELGVADVVVNNAGFSVPALVHEVRTEDLQAEIATNLVGPILVARRAIQALRREARGGDLVFVSSENAVRPRTYQVGYTASKMGLEGVARVLRMELEGSGIRSIIIRPGMTATAFGESWDRDFLKTILESWQYWGVQRDLCALPPESVASAVINAVVAPPETHVDLVEIRPTGSGKT